MTVIYQCGFSPEQLRVILQALDIYSRIGQGQLWPIADLFIGNDQVDLTKLREILRSAGPLITELAPNSYFGINSKEVDEIYKMAYDMQQVLRNAQSWNESPTGGWTANFDEPMQYAEHELMKKPEVIEVEPI